ncbi:hypothetical protein BFS16_03020 [Hoylesella timonensis]|uniref:Uncharacterized protein n=1 Tax=Hoylesella timonensis TaxID=386414 RepID=A0A2K0XNA6_9BACT|nr:hypothetical protein [Hoylesella timonensis]PNP96030.1 hypothetical protein BFS16_03020 [Hoylesella timonensis]
MKKIYQQPLIDIIKINADDLLKTVVASLEDDAAGAKQFDFNDSFEDNDGPVWSADDYKQEP